MSSPHDQPHPADTRQSDDRKHSPPAFLDLADSSARLGSNMPELSARVELKRMGHDRQRIELERQRSNQRKIFGDELHALGYEQEKDRQELLTIPADGNAGNSLPRYASAPATPPLRADSALGGGISPHVMDATLLSAAVGKAEKRKSVTYAPISSDYEAPVPMGLSGNVSSTRQISYRSAGFAKSMPASRRTSRSSEDEDLAEHLHGLSVADSGYESPLSSVPQSMGLYNGKDSLDSDGVRYVANGNGNGYSAGMLLDQQLEKEMNNAISHLPTADDEKYAMNKNQLSSKLSTSSAALDLAPLSQTPPRGSFIRMPDSREKASEWPQFPAAQRNDGPRRTATTPQIGVQTVLSASATPFAQQTPVTSRRSSPLGIQTSNLRPEILMKKGPVTPQSAEAHNLARLSGRRDSSISPSDGSGPLSRRSPSQYESPGGYGGSALENAMQAQFSVDSVYLNGQGSENGRFANYIDSNRATPAGSTAGSTALYQHGNRYGLNANARFNGHDHKLNGFAGPKHRRHDADPSAVNRFAGTQLEDLQGQIAHLCKDQHGCRYLQKKLEEGQAEHRDMIFRETFSHFAELMVDPFGNYLCQKLLEYSTDEQRNMICESVAQDLVSISLNMHGTRAVQKMIDFLTTQRQADLRCNVQIHSIIVALSLHVVVLIKDLNGNHVIQKCLNKLAPEDNQFIYNAVAANCVEVATHRHGCCVLQRCIDHASENQRVQLVNEITFNALTLVQDPYGNYVVQYILDLNDNRFSDAVIRQFTGNVCALSVQKFSSNVIEKCIRVAEHNTRKMLIEELLNRTRLEKLLRDSFGNYCVQTALDYADPAQRAMLVEGIRPILPLIRNTPYGKRIQSKLQREQMEQAHTNGIQYGGNGYANQPHQQQMMNMNMGNQGLSPGHGHHHHPGMNRHVSQPNLRQASQMSEMYDPRASMYAMQQQNGGRMHAQHQMHGQQMHHGMQRQGIDSYVLQQGAQHGMPAANGYNNVGGFANGMPVASFGNNMPLTGAINDPYQQHTAYATYGM
ncbi:ARM repeat-containing protein [Schizopora paradoxa]|uniref:ARM repeat-containing protein n=1 Tax=Schizopora paradoxa TaxID=27342 RepID=A0A0H2SF79_9AGAM|nr:ARM repeat-containing protein [Schizopora paradoxa]